MLRVKCTPSINEYSTTSILRDGELLSDVLGFIKNKAKNYKAMGVWKVYGDTAKAQKSFDSFKKCSEETYRRFKSGVGLEQLIG